MSAFLHMVGELTGRQLPGGLSLVQVATGVIVAVFVLVLVATHVRQRKSVSAAGTARRPGSWATRVYWLAALVGINMSLNTSWTFVGERVGITNPVERVGMFAGAELVLLGCGLAARAAARDGKAVPAAARWVAWSICGVSAFMAIELSGLGVGLVRVALGPVLGIIASHLALGIELRHARGNRARSGVGSRIAGEVRERLLSRIGLADDDRDALTRTRDRAALRAARLVNSGGAQLGRWRRWRVARALRTAGVAHDPERRQLMLHELAVLRYAAELSTVDLPSPWSTSEPGGTFDVPVIVPTEVPAEVPVNVPADVPGEVPADVPAAWLAPVDSSPRAVDARRWPVFSVRQRIESDRNELAGDDADDGADDVPGAPYGAKRAALRAEWDAARERGECPDGPTLRDAVRGRGVRVSARLARRYASEWAAELVDQESPAVTQ